MHTFIHTCLYAQYLRRGSKVTIVARSQSKLDDAKAALQSTGSGGQLLLLQTYSVDVGESQEVVTAAFEKIVQSFGEVDILVNCAGTSISGTYKYFVFKHVHTYIHTYIHTCTHIYIHTYIHTYIHFFYILYSTYIHTYIHTVHTYMLYVYIYTYIRTYILYIHTYIHTLICLSSQVTMHLLKLFHFFFLKSLSSVCLF